LIAIHKKHIPKALRAGKGKKVIITETGWPSEGSNLAGAVPSEENAMKYFINAQTWSKKRHKYLLFLPI
jgi:exo-beta-1,3-glucanase (GH17 family)